MENNQQQSNSKTEYELKRQQKLAEEKQKQKIRTLKRFSKIALLVIILGGIVGGGIWYAILHLSKPRTNREVVLACTTDMATQFHIHPNLQIMVNGQNQEIPANIGINAGCMHAIHTHDSSGTLHVEAPQKRDFTLGDFFAVWGKTFNKNQILDYKVDENHVIKETVNGKETQDYENTILYDKNEIIISYEIKK